MKNYTKNVGDNEQISIESHFQQEEKKIIERPFCSMYNLLPTAMKLQVRSTF